MRRKGEKRKGERIQLVKVRENGTIVLEKENRREKGEGQVREI